MDGGGGGSSDSRPALEVSDHKRKLWLVKVPNEVADAFNAVTEDGVDLGTLTYYPPESKKKCTVQLKKRKELRDKDGKKKPMPTKFTLNLRTPPAEMRIFSETSHGDSVKMEGVVVQNCSLQPERNLQYRKTCRSRQLQALQKERFVRETDPVSVVREQAVSFNTSHTGSSEQQGKGDVAQMLGMGGGRSRERMDPKDLTRAIIRKFEEKNFWGLKELNHHLNQPETYLKEALKDICQHHRSGENKGTFSLKAEYKAM